MYMMSGKAAHHDRSTRLRRLCWRARRVGLWLSAAGNLHCQRLRWLLRLCDRCRSLLHQVLLLRDIILVCCGDAGLLPCLELVCRWC